MAALDARMTAATILVGSRPVRQPAREPMPAVYRLSDRRLRMYYVGGNGTSAGARFSPRSLPTVSPGTRKPGSACTEPGRLDAVGVVKPSLIRLPDGRVRMFSVGMDGSTARILTAIAHGESE